MTIIMLTLLYLFYGLEWGRQWKALSMLVDVTIQADEWLHPDLKDRGASSIVLVMWYKEQVHLKYRFFFVTIIYGATIIAIFV